MRVDATEMVGRGRGSQDGIREHLSLCPVGLVEECEAAMQQGSIEKIQLQDDKFVVVLANLWDVAFRCRFCFWSACMTITWS